MQTYAKHAVLFLTLIACGGKRDDKPPKPPPTPPPPTPDAATPAIVIDAAPPPPDAAIATISGQEPPTTESVHVELGWAMRRWMATPRDPALYSKDFAGRSEPDARVELVPFDQFVRQLPTKHEASNPTVRTWLDPGSSLADGESRANVSVFYKTDNGDGREDYRELAFVRADGAQKIVKASVNSRNTKQEFRPYRIHFPVDATSLGKTLTARVRIEGGLAWFVLENERRVQAVGDLWPDAGNTCGLASKDGALVVVRCTGAGAGQDFTIVRDKSSVFVRLTPANKDAPMSTDLEIQLAPGAKLVFEMAGAGVGSGDAGSGVAGSGEAGSGSSAGSNKRP